MIAALDQTSPIQEIIFLARAEINPDFLPFDPRPRFDTAGWIRVVRHWGFLFERRADDAAG